MNRCYLYSKQYKSSKYHRVAGHEVIFIYYPLTMALAFHIKDSEDIPMLFSAVSNSINLFLMEHYVMSSLFGCKTHTRNNLLFIYRLMLTDILLTNVLLILYCLR